VRVCPSCASSLTDHFMERLSLHPLPEEAYLPGLNSRPDLDFPSLPSTFDFESDWSTLELYRFGLDCLNHDLGWECHETLETIWHRVGRKTTRAGVALQSLILLGSARVKALSGKDHLTLVRRALERMSTLEGRILYGLDWREVKGEAERLAKNPQHRISLTFLMA